MLLNIVRSPPCKLMIEKPPIDEGEAKGEGCNQLVSEAGDDSQPEANEGLGLSASELGVMEGWSKHRSAVRSER